MKIGFIIYVRNSIFGSTFTRCSQSQLRAIGAFDWLLLTSSACMFHNTATDDLLDLPVGNAD